MPKDVTVTCDQCGADLTRTGNCEGYRTVVYSESIPSYGGFVTAMAVEAEFPKPMYFCNYRTCFLDWAKAKTGG